MPQSEPSNSRAIIVHRGHIGSVYSVAFSPDGESIASGSEDTSIRIWDAYRPLPIGSPLNGHTGRVWSVCYSPLGETVVSGSGGGDYTVRLWNTQTGQQVGEALEGRRGGVHSVAFSPSGNLIASGFGDKTIQLWSVQSSVAFSGSLEGHTSWVTSAVFSPNGTQIISGSADKTVRIWDVEHQTMVGGALKGHDNTIRSVSISPDGCQIVTGSYDQTLRLWDIRTGSMIGAPFKGHTHQIQSVAFSPGGTYVASSSADNTVRIWDIRTHTQVEESFEQHTGKVYSVAFSPCGRRVASGSEDKTVMIWNMLGADSAVGHDHYSMTEEKNENNEGVKPGDSTVIERTEKSMLIQGMFDRLLRNGCVDLTSQMDTELDTAILRITNNFGDTYKGELQNGIRFQIRTWRASLIEQCSKDTLECAIKDIQAWSKMKHKNVHQLMGIAMPNGHYLGLITERMENGSLHEYMRNNPSIDRHHLCTQIATGLACMHQSDMVHGDLRGLNVLVSSNGVAKLSNFGLLSLSTAYISFSEANNTQPGATRWVAPELLSAGASKTKSSDVYALGMTMLEVITGDVPYSQCQWDFQALSQVMQGELPPRPVDLKDNESGNQMWELLMSCWNRSPKLRPSAKEVILSLVMAPAD